MEIYDHVAFGRREPPPVSTVYDNNLESAEFEKLRQRYRYHQEPQSERSFVSVPEKEHEIHMSIIENFSNFYYGTKYYNGEGADGHKIRYFNRTDPVTSNRTEINKRYYRSILGHIGRSQAELGTYGSVSYPAGPSVGKNTPYHVSVYQIFSRVYVRIRSDQNIFVFKMNVTPL